MKVKNEAGAAFSSENEIDFNSALLEKLGLKDSPCATLKSLAAGEGTAGAAATVFSPPPSVDAAGGAVAKPALLINCGNGGAGWTPAKAYSTLSDPDGAVPRAIALRDARLWYCSHDFAAAENAAARKAAADAVAVAKQARALAPDWPHDLAKLRAGMNFHGRAALLPDLPPDIRGKIGFDKELELAGVVGAAKEGLFIDLWARITGAEWKFCDDRLSIAITAAGVRAEELDAQGAKPQFGVQLKGEIALDAEKLIVTLILHPGATRFEIIGESPQGLKAKALVEKLLPDLGDQLKSVVKDVGAFIPNLERFQAEFPLSGDAGVWLAVGFGYSEPFKFFDGLVQVSPTVVASARYQGGKLVPSAYVRGRWQIKSATFDTALSIPGGDFSACLAPGSKVELPDDIAKIVNKATSKQTIQLIGFNLEGNVKKGEFSLEITTAGFLSFPVGNSKISIGDIFFSISRKVDVIEGKSVGKYKGKLAGTIGIGVYDVELTAAVSDTLAITCNVPRIPIGDLAADLLQIEAPAELRALEIQDFRLDLVLGGARTQINLEAKSNATFKVGGLEITLTQLKVAYAGVLELSGEARLKCDQTTVDLKLGYDAGTWSLSADVKTAFNLGKVLDALAKEIGFQSPFGDKKLMVSEFYVDLRFGAAGPRIAIFAKFSLDNAPFSLAFVAARLSDGKKEPSWKYHLKAGPVTINFQELPFVGPPIRVAADAAKNALGKDKADTQIGDLSVRLAASMAGDEAQSLFKGLSVERFGGPDDLPNPISVSGEIRLLDYKKKIVYPSPKGEGKPATESDKPKSETGAADKPPAPSDPSPPKPPAKKELRETATWLQVDRSVGPVRVDRIGFAMEDKKLAILLDAGAKIGPVEARLVGLEVKADVFGGIKPEFGLSGLEVSVKTSAFSLGGALMKSGNRYAGMITVTFGKITLNAMGAYSREDDGTTSLFIFATLLMPIGGPPFFFVNGLAAGIGFNNELSTVNIEGVSEHPFVVAAMGKKTVKIDDVLGLTKTRKDQNWAAIGVRFTSFQMLDGVAILIVSFGVETRIQVLARLDLSFPPKIPNPMLYVELGILADFRPAIGELRVEGRLSPNSFLLHKDARLSGGFALYAWMDPSPYSGDFVLTLGGYHPNFQRPKHYPVVPALELNWPVTKELTIIGRQYFALTPSAIMAGGSLKVAWRSGSDRAWFDFEAHFLIRFKPFSYSAVVNVSVGLEVTIALLFVRETIAVSLGVGVELWGPPFGGRARVSFKVFSLTIEFGGKKPGEEKALDWPAFRQAFLPPARSKECALPPGETDSLITLSASGLRRRFTPVGQTAEVWEIDPFSSKFEVRCAAPISEVKAGGAPIASKAQFGVPAMGIEPGGLKTVLTVTCAELKDNGTEGADVTGLFAVSDLTGNLPAGIWGAPTKAGEQPPAPLIKDALNGVAICVKTNNRKGAPKAAADATPKERGKTAASWSKAAAPGVKVGPAAAGLGAFDYDAVEKYRNIIERLTLSAAARVAR